MKICQAFGIPYFFDQTLRLLFILLLVFLQLLFEGGIYFFGKPVDINDGRRRYAQVIWQRRLDSVSGLHSLSVLLSAVETSRTTQTALALAWWPSLESIHTCVCAMCTSHSYYSREAFILLRASLCTATIQAQWLFKEIQYMWLEMRNNQSIWSGISRKPKVIIYTHFVNSINSHFVNSHFVSSHFVNSHFVNVLVMGNWQNWERRNWPSTLN